MCTNTRFGVGGCLTSENNYSTNTLSLYDFWYVYHPKHWARALADHGIAPLVRKRSRPLILHRDARTGQITVILCRNGWVLANEADGHQEKNLMQRPYGDGMVFPASDHRSPTMDKWLEDHGFTHPYRARQWCPVHRMLHGHTNFASPTFHGDCMDIRVRESYPEDYIGRPLSQFVSIPQDTFRCAHCGKHAATLRKERQQVWRRVKDTYGWGRDSWDAASLAEKAHTCCGA